MESNYVLEHLPTACNNFELQEAFLLSHVEGELEDEDGDWATDFIIADPLPPGHGYGGGQPSSWEIPPPPRSSSAKKRHFTSDADAAFICLICSQYLPLELLGPDLECGCLCCMPCLRQHIESRLSQNHIEGRDSDGIEAFREHHSPKETLDSMPCPSCSCEAAISTRNVRMLAPEACRFWEEEASLDFFKAANYVRCPGCNVMIEKVMGDIPAGVAPSGVPEFDRTVPFTELDDHGRPLSRIALFHKYSNYYRCSLCKANFCGLCMKLPYHLGYTCHDYEEFQKTKRCIYCETPILGSYSSENQASFMTVRDLQKGLNTEGVDISWCVEKWELLSVWRLASSICDAKDCRRQLHNACTRNLECGHWCGGLRGERACLPCLEDGCRENVLLPEAHSLPSADDWCTICMVEPLRSAPSIQLKCGHVIHFDCAKKKLKEGFPGPEITFGYLKCPQCSEYMEHESLVNLLQKPLELLNLVKERALKRVMMEKLSTSMKPVELEAYALHKYQYYLCCKCQNPYYGGNRDCAVDLGLDDLGARNPHNPLELVCGGCSAAIGDHMTCNKGHGKKYVEYKCRYCCSMATYFCFGQIHFCSSCHLTRPDGNPYYVPQPCKGPHSCPLKVAHAPNGKEYCLGCSMCRILSQ